MSHNKRCYIKKINKSAAQGSRRVDLMFKQASLKAFTSDFHSRSRRDVMSHVIYLTTRPPLMFGGKSSDKLSMKRNQ